MYKRLLSFVITLLMVLSIGTTALADSQDAAFSVPIVQSEKYYSSNSLSIFDIDKIGGFREYLFQQLSTCNPSIDISNYNFAYTDKNISDLRCYIWERMPEAFHAEGIGFRVSGSKLTHITVSYSHTASQFSTMYDQCVAVADELLSGIKGNSKLTDVQKALLLHDRIALLCEYDLNYADISHNMYGALVNNVAVCQGYSEAYAYLLNQLGIDNYICESDLMLHAWNIIYINNIPYHVDITWDDPLYDTTGKVTHTNFLRSSTGIMQTGHHLEGSVDYDTSPNDTTYDNYYWQNSTTAFQLLNDQLYYIDNQAQTLNHIDNGVHKALCSVEYMWEADRYHAWVGNYARLSNDGTNLLYSLGNGVYSYDINRAASTRVFTPDFSIGDYFAIYGFTYLDGYLICDLSNTPNFTATTKEQYQIKQAYTPVEYIPTIDKETSLDVSGEGNGKTVSGFKLGHTVGSVTAVSNGVTVEFYKDDQKASATDKIATGMTMKIISGGEVTDYAQVIVYGDVNGDGNINATDTLKIKQHMLSVASLEGCYLQAGKISRGDNVTAADMLKLKRYLLGVDTIEQ